MDQVVVNPHPAGVTVIIGKLIDSAVSERRSKFVVPPLKEFSTTVGVREPHVSVKVIVNV